MVLLTVRGEEKSPWPQLDEIIRLALQYREIYGQERQILSLLPKGGQGRLYRHRSGHVLVGAKNRVRNVALGKGAAFCFPNLLVPKETLNGGEGE